MGLNFLRWLLPDRRIACPVLMGPFRGARIFMNPRNSLRKIMGAYEHELNPWLHAVLARVDGVYDVGANDGYFTFGCLAAFRRRGRAGSVFAFEPQEEAFRGLSATATRYCPRGSRLELVRGWVGDGRTADTMTLDDWVHSVCPTPPTTNVLIKVDVEGAELQVLRGAQSLIRPENQFLIEVHSAALLRAVSEFFAQRSLPLVQINQKALPILGRENRDVDNWWLVTPV
jgi:methyltransferase FkbM-like protein